MNKDIKIRESIILDLNVLPDVIHLIFNQQEGWI
jgi:hypothetical protein